MADVDVPAVGKVPQKYVLGAAGVVAGIAGWAYLKRSQTPAPVAAVPAPQPGASDYVSPGSNSSGSSISNPDVISTNDQWSRKAAEHLSNQGFEPTLVSVALGKYLGRAKLTDQETRVVQAAVGAFGPPPVGGPYPIQTEPTSTEPDRHYVPDKVIGTEPNIAGSPWIWVTLKKTPTNWADVATEIYRADPNDPAWQQRATVVGSELQRINQSYGAGLPKIGDVVYFR